jgi:hypothetical protein
MLKSRSRAFSHAPTLTLTLTQKKQRQTRACSRRSHYCARAHIAHMMEAAAETPTTTHVRAQKKLLRRHSQYSHSHTTTHTLIIVLTHSRRSQRCSQAAETHAFHALALKVPAALTTQPRSLSHCPHAPHKQQASDTRNTLILLTYMLSELTCSHHADIDTHTEEAAETRGWLAQHALIRAHTLTLTKVLVCL